MSFTGLWAIPLVVGVKLSPVTFGVAMIAVAGFYAAVGTAVVGKFAYNHFVERNAPVTR
jgi:hypothetical protein